MKEYIGTAIPRSGEVSKIYFNTKLTKEEVVDILSKLPFTPIMGGGVCFIMANETGEFYFPIFRFDTEIEGQFDYIIGGDHSAVFILSETGWTQQLIDNGSVITYSIPIISVPKVTLNDRAVQGTFIVGNCNEYLSNLVSITPFEYREKTLDDTFTSIANSVRGVAKETKKLTPKDMLLSLGKAEKIEKPAYISFEYPNIPLLTTYFNSNLEKSSAAFILVLKYLNENSEEVEAGKVGYVLNGSTVEPYSALVKPGTYQCTLGGDNITMEDKGFGRAVMLIKATSYEALHNPFAQKSPVKDFSDSLVADPTNPGYHKIDPVTFELTVAEGEFYALITSNE